MKLIILLYILLITGCGKSSNSNKKTAEITLDQISNLLENQSFSCDSASGNECPDALARLFILNTKSPNLSSLCSGFLTRSNRLITNAHCVSTEEECNKTYIVIYVQGDYHLARCQRVIKLFEDFKPLEMKSLDIAILELDRHFKELNTFKGGKGRLMVGDVASAWVIDHVSLFEARITELQCTLKERAESFVFKNCAAISGNSGSPIVNNKGEVTSVLWGSTTDDSVDESFPLNSRRILESTAYATDAWLIRSFF